MKSVYRGVSYQAGYGWVATYNGNHRRCWRSEQDALAARKLMEEGILDSVELRRRVAEMDIEPEGLVFMTMRERKQRQASIYAAVCEAEDAWGRGEMTADEVAVRVAELRRGLWGP